MHPLYLKVEEGKRFIAFLFTLHVDFIAEIHMTVKNQISSGNKNVIVSYAEVIVLFV
jgi:condensin-2 complex subunit G2